MRRQRQLLAFALATALIAAGCHLGQGAPCNDGPDPCCAAPDGQSCRDFNECTDRDGGESEAACCQEFEDFFSYCEGTDAGPLDIDGDGGPNDGGRTDAGDAGHADAGDGGAADGGTTPCGTMTCTATQVCDISYPGVMIPDGGPMGPYYDGCVDAPPACFAHVPDAGPFDGDAGCACFGVVNPCPGGGMCLNFVSPHVLVCE